MDQSCQSNRLMLSGGHMLKPLFVLLLASLAAGCGDQLSSVPIGAPASAFVLNHLDGHPVRFPDDYRDQVVAIRFWADWCPYCHNEMAALEPVYRQYHDQGLFILAVNVMQSPATARTFTDRLGISYDVLLDSQGDVMRRYGVMGLPMTFIVDRQGIVRARIIGEATADIFAQAVRPLLQRRTSSRGRHEESAIKVISHQHNKTDNRYSLFASIPRINTCLNSCNSMFKRR